MSAMSSTAVNRIIQDQIWQIIRKEAEDIIAREECLKYLINETILNHATFIDALGYKISSKLGSDMLPAKDCFALYKNAMKDEDGTLERCALEDLIAVESRDPACRGVCQVFLYFKGYKSLQAYRFAHMLWMQGRKDLAMLIQARCTEVFGIDIHPGASLGPGMVIDHGTGVVIGETSVVGKNCTFLHGITLGATGWYIHSHSFIRSFVHSFIASAA